MKRGEELSVFAVPAPELAEVDREAHQAKMGEVMGRFVALVEGVGAKKERRRIVALLRQWAEIYDDASKALVLRLAKRIEEGGT